MTCPECARQIRRPREMVRSERRWRWGRIAATAAVMLFAASRTPFIRHGRWTKFTPTTPLVVLERALGVHAPKGVRNEVSDRLTSRKLSTDDTNLLIPRLIADLAADRHLHNADRAMGLLWSMGSAPVPALEAALRSDDWQQRQLAAHVLRAMPGYDPCDDLLRVCADGLRNDALPRGGGRYSWVYNAREGSAYLVRFRDRIAPFIAPGLHSTDMQERFLCAAVAGFAGCTDLAPRAVPILLEHLKDNKIGGDAQIAAPALYHFGPGIVPLIEPYEYSADRQQRVMVRLVLYHLRTPKAKRPPDLEGVRVTTRTGDPVTDLTIEDMQFWSFHR